MGIRREQHPDQPRTPSAPGPDFNRIVRKDTTHEDCRCIARFLTAFAAYGRDLAGSYVLHGEMEVGAELLLKPDGKFEFMLAYGAADYWAKGTWKHDGNTVILHSAGKKEEPFKLLRSEAGEIRVFVLGQNKKALKTLRCLDYRRQAARRQNG